MRCLNPSLTLWCVLFGSGVLLVPEVKAKGINFFRDVVKTEHVQSEDKICTSLPKPNAGKIDLPVYQALPMYDRYFSFIAINMELHYYVQYARELAQNPQFENTEKYGECLKKEFLSYSAVDPFADYIVLSEYAQSIVEIDHTLRSLAYIYKSKRHLFTQVEQAQLAAYFLAKVDELAIHFATNSHAELYKNWHALTVLLIGTITKNRVMLDKGNRLFGTILNELERNMGKAKFDLNGYWASYYKATLNSLVAMAELSIVDKYADGRLLSLIDTLLKLDEKNSSELFVKLPDNFVATSKLSNDFITEVSDNVYRLRYEFDHRTHMAWLHIVSKKFPNKRIKEAVKKYTFPLVEEHVGFELNFKSFDE
jgi:hypothetical protein